MKPFLLLLLVLALTGCASSERSSEAAWHRGQCEQILDEKMRLKCLERVESEYGR